MRPDLPCASCLAEGKSRCASRRHFPTPSSDVVERRSVAWARRGAPYTTYGRAISRQQLSFVTEGKRFAGTWQQSAAELFQETSPKESSW